MIEQIKEATSLSEIQELFKLTDGQFVDSEEDYFVKNIISMWENGVLQEKLRILNEHEMAKRIDDVNMNQTCGDICREICNIILGKVQKAPNKKSSDNWTDFSHDDWMFNRIWSEPDF